MGKKGKTKSKKIRLKITKLKLSGKRSSNGLVYACSFNDGMVVLPLLSTEILKLNESKRYTIKAQIIEEEDE